jgi:hypothetical protein
MAEQMTEKMASEFTISKEADERLRAGCLWLVCNKSTPRKDIEKEARSLSITYDIAMKWRDYWLDLYRKHPLK